MHIAAHISGTDHEKSLLLAILRILVVKYPNHRFTFFSEKEIEDLGRNCTQTRVAPKITNNILLYFWYSYRLHKMLVNKNKLVFISEAGMLCHAAKGCSQYLFYDNDYFWQDSNAYFKKAWDLTLKKAKKIFTSQDYFADEFLRQVPNTSIKTEPIYYGLDTQKKLLAPVTLEMTKNKYADGCDYYLYVVTQESKKYLIKILKAFSQLKKLQKTSMRMLFLLNNVYTENLIDNFKNYKYKEEVYILEETTENKKHIISAANGMFYFDTYEANGYAIMALQNEVPLILESNNKHKAIYKEAALYCEVNENSISEKMQLMYKDESVRQVLTIEANKWLEKYNVEKAADQLYDAIYIP